MIDVEPNREVTRIGKLKDDCYIVNTKIKIQKYSKLKGHQWKKRTEYTSNSSQPVLEYGTILDIDSTPNIKRQKENQEQCLNLA